MLNLHFCLITKTSGFCDFFVIFPKFSQQHIIPKFSVYHAIYCGENDQENGKISIKTKILDFFPIFTLVFPTAYSTHICLFLSFSPQYIIPQNQLKFVRFNIRIQNYVSKTLKSNFQKVS